MDSERIKNQLKTQWLGQSIFFKESVDSTNHWAEASLDQNSKRGDLFLTDYQSMGHGRLKRIWESPPAENILASFLDTSPNAKAYQLTLVCGVAIANALENLFPQYTFQLKWPNDILVQQKKLAGILCKNINPWVIVGLGLNVNMHHSSLPPSIQKIAISLSDLVGHDLHREDILAACLNSYEEKRNLYDHEGLQSIILSWNDHCAHLNRKIRINDEGKIQEGFFEGLNQDGFLLLRNDKGTEIIVSGDVEIL